MNLHERFLELHPEYKTPKRIGKGDIVWHSSGFSGQVIEVLKAQLLYVMVDDNKKSHKVSLNELDKLF